MDHQSHSHSRWLLSLGAVAAVSLITNVNAGTTTDSGKAPVAPPESISWKDHTIAPVTNPIFFEDAVIRSEIRPIFAYHNIDDEFLGGGNAQLYAM